VDEAVAEFLEWGERLGRKPATLARYGFTLKQFPDPLHATREEVEAWWKRRFEVDKVAPATMQNELACLRTFYRWAQKFDHRDDDPTRRLDSPHVDNTNPRPVPRAEIIRALAACDERGSPDLRRAIALGAYAGLRISEVAALDWAKVDIDGRQMWVRGKGGKERLVAIGPKLLDELLPKPEKGGNVVRAGLPAYRTDTLQRRVNRFFDTLGIPHTFHNLRARYVTQGIADSGDIFAVSRAVGWASIETAKHYAVLADDALQRIAAAAER
jgi:integrase